MDDDLRYEVPPRSTASDVRAALAAGDTEAASRALVGASFHNVDGKAVQSLCLEFLGSTDRSMAALAATCLGHLARVHGQVELDLVVPALQRHQQDRMVGPRAESALEDIEDYVGLGPGDRASGPRP